MAEANGDDRKADGSGMGLTLKQLVLEVREDVRAMRIALEEKADRAELNILRIKVEAIETKGSDTAKEAITEVRALKGLVDRAMSGEVVGAYQQSAMKEYNDLKTTVKELEKDREKANIAAGIAKAASDKQANNRKWIIGLVVAAVIQAGALILRLWEYYTTGHVGP